MTEWNTAIRTIETLRDEHNGVLYVLDQLERAVSAAEQKGAVPKALFSDVQEFFAIFVDKCHHGKAESELITRFTTPRARTLVERLDSQYVTGRQLAGAYASAALAYQPGVAESGGRLAVTARGYAAFLREHIALETDELFQVTQALAGQDQELMDSFERVEEERIGPGTHEWLHGMIDGLGARLEPLLT